MIYPERIECGRIGACQGQTAWCNNSTPNASSAVLEALGWHAWYVEYCDEYGYVVDESIVFYCPDCWAAAVRGEWELP